jgi:DNA-binding response OmpR family regulator
MTKVLLVDDDEMCRDMLSRRLIRRGFEVIFAVDGKQAIGAARREKPDIILMDMSLPVRSAGKRPNASNPTMRPVVRQ